MAGKKKENGGLKPEDAALWARVAETMDARMPDKPSPAEIRRLLPEGQNPAKRASSVQCTGEAFRSAKRAGTSGKTSSKDAKSNILPPSRHLLRASLPMATGMNEARAESISAGTLDRRTRQRLLRGQVTIEARIDLHGLSVEEARQRLRGFIVASRQRGLRTILVITGKGAAPFTRHTLHGHDHWHAPERQGVLRRELPRWLSEPDMQVHVSGFQPAHPRHGGGGAFYVRLRRKNRGRAP